MQQSDNFMRSKVTGLLSSPRCSFYDTAFDEDDTSSIDSAVDITPREFRSKRKILFNSKKTSFERVFLTSSERFNRPSAEFLTRSLDSRNLDELMYASRRSDFLSVDDDLAHCYSSSESCMSLDESSLLSPSSSLSSYGDSLTETELWFAHTQLERYEYRLRSRERFQELIQRWESKQAANKQDGAGSPSDGKESGLGEADGKLDPDPSILELRFQDLMRRWESRENRRDENIKPSLVRRKQRSQKVKPSLIHEVAGDGDHK